MFYETFEYLQIADTFSNPNIFNDIPNAFLNSVTSFHVIEKNLLREVMKRYPKKFIIKNKSNEKKYNFCRSMISSQSSVIRKLPKDVEEFEIDIDDPNDTMQKFTDIYNGMIVDFDSKTDKPFFHKLASALDLKLPLSIFNSNHEMIPLYRFIEFPKTFKIGISSSGLYSYFRNLPNNFNIQIKDKIYQCNKFLVVLSQKIHDAIIENNDLTEFVYEIEDSQGYFSTISQFFKCSKGHITSQNIEFLEKASTDLGIDFLLEKIQNYKLKFEKCQEILGLEQERIDSVISLQELLFDLSEDTIEDTLKSIFESKWLEGKENIKEFSSNLAIVASTRINLHELIIQLITPINEKISFFLPFFSNYILKLSSLSMTRFIYMMYKAKLIDINIILDTIRCHAEYDSDSKKYNLNTPLGLWFFPEFDEKYPYIMKSFISRFPDDSAPIKNKLKSYQKNNWDVYKKEREILKNNDPIALVIQEDDVHQLQNLIISLQFKGSYVIPASFFENFEPISPINYAALHGSLSCFKFLLNSNKTINKQTISYAITGGNLEIIRLSVANNSEEIENDLLPQNYIENHNIDPRFGFEDGINHFYDPTIISTAIKYHRYGVFDFLLQILLNKSNINEILTACLCHAISCNNLVSFMKIIDQGISFGKDTNQLNDKLHDFAIDAAYNGFSDLLLVISRLTDKSIFNQAYKSPFTNAFKFKYQRKYEKEFPSRPNSILEAASSFGSIPIIKLVIESRKELSFARNEIISSLVAAASNDNIDVIELLLSSVPIPEDEKIYTKFLKAAAYFNKKNVIYTYSETCKKCDWLSVLCSAASTGRFEIIKFIFENKIILNNLTLASDATSENSSTEFKEKSVKSLREAFCLAAINGYFDICQYFNQNQITLSFHDIFDNIEIISKKGFVDILKLFFEMSTTNQRIKLSHYYLNNIIKSGNIPIIKLFIQYGRVKADTLIQASKTGLNEIVSIICDTHPELLNQITSIDGSPLCAASASGKLEVVETLLSHKGIDLNLYNQNHETAIIIASKSHNSSIMKRIIQEYFNQIEKTDDPVERNNKRQSLFWQINSAFVAYNFRSTNFSHFVKNNNDVPYPFARRHAPIQQMVITTDEDNKSIDDSTEMIYYFFDFPFLNPNFIYNDSTALLAAISQNNYDWVSYLIQRPDVDVNMINSEGKTPLMLSISLQYEKIISLLLSIDRIDVNFMNSQYQSAISICANLHVPQTIVNLVINSTRFLLDNINTNIAIAQASTSNFDLFNTLLALNFDINRSFPSTKTKNSHETVLSYASKFSTNEQVLLAILNHPKFDPTKNDLVFSIFHVIKLNLLAPFNRLLMFLNNDVNIKNHSGVSLLLYSLQYFSFEITFAILLHQNFDPIRSDAETAFLFCLLSKTDVLQTLVAQLQLDINAPLHLSSNFHIKFKPTHRNRRLNQFTFHFLNDKNTMNLIYGNTPLAIACHHADVLKELLTFDGIDINRKCENGSAPIFEAILIRNRRVIDLIRRNDFDVNIQNSKGQTPLMFAILKADLTIVNALLEKEQIDINIQDFDGLTAFDYLLAEFDFNDQHIEVPTTSHEFSMIVSLLSNHHSDEYLFI